MVIAAFADPARTPVGIASDDDRVAALYEEMLGRLPEVARAPGSLPRALWPRKTPRSTRAKRSFGPARCASRTTPRSTSRRCSFPPTRPTRAGTASAAAVGRRGCIRWRSTTRSTRFAVLDDPRAAVRVHVPLRELGAVPLGDAALARRSFAPCRPSSRRRSRATAQLDLRGRRRPQPAPVPRGCDRECARSGRLPVAPRSHAPRRAAGLGPVLAGRRVATTKQWRGVSRRRRRRSRRRPRRTRPSASRPTSSRTARRDRPARSQPLRVGVRDRG